MPYHLYTLLLGCLLTLNATAFAQNHSSKAEPAKPSWFDGFSEFFRKVPSVGEVNPQICETCATNTPPKALPIDSSIAWLKGHVKCDNFAYLQSQRENLIRAEKQFGVPAPMVACLIGAESAWDLNADQLRKRSGTFRGSFVGLVQSFKPTLKTMQYDIATDPVFSKQWAAYNPDIRPDIIARDTMYVRQGVVLSCPIQRCGGVPTPSEKDRIARASIAFVSIYVKQNIERMRDFLATSPQYGPQVAADFLKTNRTQYLVAAIGYNAGPGTMSQYTPAVAYTQDNGSWKYHLNSKRKNLSKTGEVAQYIDWIDTCMNANPLVGPPDRTALLEDTKCFGKASPEGLRKLLAVRRPPDPKCSTDPVLSCSGPKAFTSPVLTRAQIRTQRKNCPPLIATGAHKCPI